MGCWTLSVWGGATVIFQHCRTSCRGGAADTSAHERAAQRSSSTCGMPDMLVIVLRARVSVKCSGPDVSTRSDGSPTSVPLEAKRTPRPSASTVALIPSGAMVTVPGPDALTVIELPVALLVSLTNRDPVILMTVDPSAVMAMVLYSLSTGNAKWTAKPQKAA